MNKVYYLLIISLYLFNVNELVAQQCNDYSCVIKKVKRAIETKNYQLAFDNLESADSYPAKNVEEISNLRQSLFRAIEKEKADAVKARDESKRQTNLAVLEQERAEQEKRKAEESSLLAIKKSNEADLALKEAIKSQNEAKQQKDSVEMKKELFLSSTQLFFSFIAEKKLNDDFISWAATNKGMGNIDAVLLEMLSTSRSIAEQNSREEWIKLLPLMNNKQKATLMSILGKEKAKVTAINIKYDEKKDSIKRKYLEKWKEMGYIKEKSPDKLIDSSQINTSYINLSERAKAKFDDYNIKAKNGNDRIESLITSDSFEVSSFINFFIDSIQNSNKIMRLDLYSKITKLSEHLITFTKSETYRIRTSQYYNSYAWYQIFAKDFDGSLKALEKGLSYDKNNIYILANIPHALLLQGKYNAAKKKNLELKDKEFDPENGIKTCLDAFSQDFKEFETEGVIPKERMEDFKKMKQELGIK